MAAAAAAEVEAPMLMPCERWDGGTRGWLRESLLALQRAKAERARERERKGRGGGRAGILYQVVTHLAGQRRGRGDQGGSPVDLVNRHAAQDLRARQGSTARGSVRRRRMRTNTWEAKRLLTAACWTNERRSKAVARRAILSSVAFLKSMPLSRHPGQAMTIASANSAYVPNSRLMSPARSGEGVVPTRQAIAKRWSTLNTGRPLWLNGAGANDAAGAARAEGRRAKGVRVIVSSWEWADNERGSP